MSDSAGIIAQHYSDEELLLKILSALEEDGRDLESLTIDDLAAVEEFHIGGRDATAYAIKKAGIAPSQHVLDVGCGIGGTARFLAAQIGCRVWGIDLTPDYIDAGNRLGELTALSDRVRLQAGNAVSMPYEDHAFDAAITIHVAMNIEDRAGFYAEVHRVLRPGSTFCIYDVMQKQPGMIDYPVPWAENDSFSFLKTPAQMQELLQEAGFDQIVTEDRTDVAIEFFKASQQVMKDNPSKLGVHLVMGDDAPIKMKNMVTNIKSGLIAPVLMIARKPA